MTCCAMVQGMRSPEARLPRDRPCITEPFEISPSRYTCSLTRGSDTSEIQTSEIQPLVGGRGEGEGGRREGGRGD